jgi:hypothetical protein
MIVYPPIAIAYIGSYYALNMIYAIDIWIFMLILDDFIKCINRLDIGMDAFTLIVSKLYYWPTKVYF